MNKKLMMIASTVALGGVMLGATAYAAVSGTSGYDIYKEAFKNTYAVQSISPKTELTVKDNGNLLVKVDSETKINKEKRSMSNSITVTSSDGQKTVDLYNQDNKTIVKSSDSSVYNIMESGSKRNHVRKEHKEGTEDQSRIQDLENVTDALVGNIQNYITLNDNSDGTKEVSLQLSDNQISPVINAVASIVVKNAGAKMEHGDFANKSDLAFLSGLQDKLPKLTSNVKVTRVEVDAKVTKDNLIQGQTENFIITGADASGKTHEVSISVNTSFAGFNSTVPDTVDLNGKQVNVIKHEKFVREAE